LLLPGGIHQAFNTGGKLLVLGILVLHGVLLALLVNYILDLIYGFCLQPVTYFAHCLVLFTFLGYVGFISQSFSSSLLVFLF
jgi:hypothetical protein